MENSPKTIHNLPSNVSVDWAQAQENLRDAPSSLEARQISGITAKDATVPFFVSQLSELLGFHPTISTWALFAPPQESEKQTTQIFAHTVVPSLDQLSIDNFRSKLQSFLNKPLSDEAHYEASVFLDMLDQLEKGNNQIESFKTRCQQYQKG